jgi:hypothetical protein
MRPPVLTAPHPLSPELLRVLLLPRDELKPPPFAASGAPPLHHCPGTSEHLPRTASTSSSSSSVTGEHRRAPAPARRALVRRCRTLCPRHPGPPWARVHHQSTTRGPVPQIIQFQNKSGNWLFQEFCKEAPRFLQNWPAIHSFTKRPLEFGK